MDNIDLCTTPVSRNSRSAKGYAQWDENRKKALEAVRRVIDSGHSARWSFSTQKRGSQNATNKSFTKEESPKCPMLQRYLDATETPKRNFRSRFEKFGDSPSKFDDGEDGVFNDPSNIEQAISDHEATVPKVKLVSGEILESKNRNIIELVDRTGIKKPVVEENGSMKLKTRLRSSRSTIRKNVPCGQTRRLTSLFESIAEANKEQSVPRHRELRTKSVPPSKLHGRKSSVSDESVFSKDDSCCIRNDHASSPFGDRISKDVPKKLICYTFSNCEAQKVEIMKSEEGVKSLARKLEDAGFVCSPSPSMRDMQSPIQNVTQQNVQKKNITPLYKAKELQEIDAVDAVKKQEIKPLIPTLEEFQVKQCLKAKSTILSPLKSVDGCKSSVVCPSSCVGLGDITKYSGSLHQSINEFMELDGAAVAQCQVSYATKGENGSEIQCIEVCDNKTHESVGRWSGSQLSCEENVGCLLASESSKISRGSSVNEVDQISVVDKAFRFVDEVDLQAEEKIGEAVMEVLQNVSNRSSYSGPSNDTPSQEVSHHSSTNSTRSNGTIVYSDDKNSNSIAKVPTFVKVNSSVKELQEEERYVNLGKKKANDMVSTKPLASSTPVMGSPTPSERIKSCESTLNRTFISSISNGICTNRMQNELDLEAELKRLKGSELYWENETVKAQTIISRRKKGTKGYNEASELFAQRDLLLARERQVMVQREIQRVRELQLSNKSWLPLYNGDRGHITIYSITIKLNRNFCLRNLDAHDSYAFLVLMKTDDKVEATDLVTLVDTRTMRINSVHFDDQIQFGNLPSDFSLKLEVFALKVREMPCIDDRSCTLLKNKAKFLLSPLRKTNMNGSIIGTTGFTSCGYTHLTKTRAGDIEVYLDETEYPLEGTINIKSSWSSITTKTAIDFSGFLAMYEVIADLGSWSRYWAVLQSGVINFWRDPNDEASCKPPIIKLDLSHCKNETVTPCSFDECYRRNTFVVNFMMQSNQSYSTKERIFLSADSKEMLDAWINVLNRTLRRIGK